MNDKKQIEEITKITCPAYHRNKEKKCAGIQECDMKCLHYQRCEALYNAGYRKQSEGEWVEYQIPHIILCSKCDWGTDVRDRKQFRYCPNCGARMKGDNNG